MGREEGCSEPGTAPKCMAVSRPALLPRPSQSRKTRTFHAGTWVLCTRCPPHVLPATLCPPLTPDTQVPAGPGCLTQSPQGLAVGQSLSSGPAYKPRATLPMAAVGSASQHRAGPRHMTESCEFPQGTQPAFHKKPLPIQGCWEMRGWASLVYKIISRGSHMNFLL